MKLTYTAVAGGLALALGLSAGSIAGEMGSGYEKQSAAPSFTELDSNSDGYLTREEVEGNTAIIESWDQADSNSDNQLDSAEFSAFEVTRETPGSAMDTPAGSDSGAPMGGTGSGNY